MKVKSNKGRCENFYAKRAKNCHTEHTEFCFSNSAKIKKGRGELITNKTSGAVIVIAKLQTVMLPDLKMIRKLNSILFFFQNTKQ
jgi:hypothetical protein